MLYSLIDFTLLHQCRPQTIMGKPKRGLDSQRFVKMFDRLVELPFLTQGISQVVMSHKTSGSLTHHILPERQAVFPNPIALICRKRKREDQNRKEGRSSFPPFHRRWKMRQSGDGSHDRCEEKPDTRQIEPVLKNHVPDGDQRGLDRKGKKKPEHSEATQPQ